MKYRRKKDFSKENKNKNTYIKCRISREKEKKMQVTHTKENTTKRLKRST